MMHVNQSTGCLQIAIGVSCLLLGASAARSADDTYDLRPHFVEGRTAQYQTWTQLQRTVTVQVGPEKQSRDELMIFENQVTWTVDKVRSDGSATCSMTYDWMTAELTGPDGKVLRNDSRKGSGDDDRLHKVLRAMNGQTLTFEVNADGSIDKVTGASAIRKAIDDEDMAPEDLDFIESATELAVIAFVPDEAKSGARWKAAFTWSHQLGQMDHDHRYTLSSVEEVAGISIATVTATGKLKLTPELPDLPPGAPKIDIKMRSGSYETQVMFDLQRHETVGRNSIESHVIEVSRRLPQITLTQTIDTTIQSQVLRITEE